jgi:hypothetical protein
VIVLRSNHSFVMDVKQDRSRKSVSNASVEAARKEKNRLKKIARMRGRLPVGDAIFQEQSFLRNFYNFVKEAIAGTIGGGSDLPEFPVEVANR